MIKDGFYRNKKDDKMTLLITQSDEGEDYIEGFNEKGIVKRYKRKTFLSKYKLENPSYLGLEKHLIQYANQVPEVSAVIQQILRRLHPGGYFHVGDVVFGTKEIEYYIQENRMGDLLEVPLEIIDISKLSGYGNMVYIISLKSIYNTRPSDKAMCIPMYQDRYSKIDAYACLRRYNMPY